MRRLLKKGVGLAPIPPLMDTLPTCNVCRFARTLDDIYRQRVSEINEQALTYVPKLICANKDAEFSLNASKRIVERNGEVCCLLFQDKHKNTLTSLGIRRMWDDWKKYRDEIFAKYVK